MLEITTYKNYKELCKAMNWEEKAGNSRVSQLKELDSLCEYHKEGNKFIIDEVYDIPREIIDKRTRNVSSEDYDFAKEVLEHNGIEIIE